MFKLASLVAVAAASTVKTDEAKAAASVKKEEKSLKHLMISGSTKVGAHFAIPETAAKPTTWADTETDCWTCAFTEGVWTKDKACVYDKAELANMAKGVTVADKKTDPKGLSLHATAAADLTYKDLFASMEGCAALPYTIKEVQVMSEPKAGKINKAKWAKSKTESSQTDCASSWDPNTFALGADTGKGTKAAPQVPAIYSWDFTWATASTGGWCYSRTVMPKTYKGGLLITHANAAHTNFAMKIDGATTSWFDNVSLIKQGVGKTGKVVQMTANAFELIMQSSSTFTKAANDAAGAGFKITVTRASYEEITLLTLEKGGVIVWVIIGIVVCILMTCAFCAWRHFHNKKDEEDKFYQIDDMYARI